MADNDLNTNIHITATNDASPKLRQLERDLDQLKDKLNNAFKPSARITESLASPKLSRHLKNMGVEVKEYSNAWARSYREMAKVGKLTETHWQDIREGLDKYEKQMRKSNRLLSNEQRSEAAKAIARAGALRSVWNKYYDAREADENRLARLQSKIDDERMRREGRNTNDLYSKARILYRLDRDNEREKDRAIRDRMGHATMLHRLERENERDQRRAQTEKRKQDRESTSEIMRQWNLKRNSAALEEKMGRDRIAQSAKDWRIRQNIHDNTMRMQEEERRQMRDSVRNPARRGVAQMGRAFSRADTPFFSSPVFYGAMAGYAGARAVGSSFGTARRADESETKLDIFGGMGREEIKRTRSGWLDSTGIKYGMGPAASMDIATEVLKAGIPQQHLQAVTEGGMKATAALGLDPSQTMKLTGRLATLTQDMKNFDPAFIGKIMNSVAVSAAELAADPDEIVAGMRRGTGALSSSKMTADQLSAFVGTGISAGMQSGRAGTFTSFLVSELVNAPKARGQRGKDLSEGARLLGLGSTTNMSKKMAQNPMDTLQGILGKMGKMDEQKRAHVANLIGMREWRDELLTMVHVQDDLDRTLKMIVSKQGFLDEAIQKQISSLTGVMKSSQAAFERVWEGIGGGFEDVFRETSEWFIAWAKAADIEKIKTKVKGVVKSLLAGFGFDSWKGVLDSVSSSFGSPDEIITSITKFAKGFGTGIKTVVEAVMGFLKLGAGAMGYGTDAEGIGRFTAEILGFSAALHTLRPVMGILGGIASFIAGIASFSAAIAAAGGLSGTAAAGFGGGMTAVAAAMKAGLIAGLAGIGTLTLTVGVAYISWKAFQWMSNPDKMAGETLTDTAGQSGFMKYMPSMDKIFTGMWIWLKSTSKGMNGSPATSDPLKGGSGSSDIKGGSGGDTLGGLIHKQSYSVDRMTNSFEQFGARIQLASLTSPGLFSGIGGGGSGGGGGGGSFTAPAFDSSASNMFSPPAAPDYGIGSRGIMGGSGGKMGQRRSALMKVAIDQLRKEGVPENSLKGAAAMLVGQAQSESGLDPTKTHDGGTGLGLYGARDPRGWGDPTGRRTAMVKWMKENGYDPLSAEGQMRYMAKEAMSGKYRNSKAILQSGRTDPAAVNEFTREFEAPKVVNNRSPAVQEALRADLSAGGVAGAGAIGLDGVPVKGAQATAGGDHAMGLSALAQELTSGGVAGGLNRFTAFNDRFHMRRRSKHNQGLASDFTIKDPRFSAEAAEQVRSKFRAAGLTDDMFKVIDEYKSPSAGATGGHIHAQFANQKAAAIYQQYVQKQRALAASQKATPAGAAAGVPTPQGITQGVPAIPAGGGGGGGHGQSVSAPITIHGGSQSPQEIANAVQRRITETMNYRTHDVESELT